ncbi:MAG: hypothetical protein JXN65_08005 [Clostridia bacterium]|nr:hypothetical protein [Clostridia bacterium]
MSKKCAICGEKINFLSENSLSSDYKNIKICFTCYEYVATGSKGSKKAIDILKSRYRSDIADKVKKYIDSQNIDVGRKSAEEEKDTFIDLVSSNENGKEKTGVKQNSTEKNNIIWMDKLSDAKRDRLIRIKIASTMLLFAFALFGPLASLYLFTQGYGGAESIIMLVVSLGFALVFGFIKAILTAVIN